MSEARPAPESMSLAGSVARRFPAAILLRQWLMGVVAYSIVAVLVPWALLLESRLVVPLVWAGFQVALLGSLLTLAATAWRLRQHAALFAAIGAEDATRLKPEDVGTLGQLPLAITARFLVCGGLGPAALFLAGMRPELLDTARAVSLCLIAVNILLAAGLVHHLVVREAVLRLIVLMPRELVEGWLEQQAVGEALQHWVPRRVLLAVVAPVALVGVGAVLVTHAHLRAFVEGSRAETARLLVRTSLEQAPGSSPEAGRDDAIAAAAVHGFLAQIERGRDPTPDETELPERVAGQMRVVVPLEDGRALVRYSAELKAAVLTSGSLLALLAVALAAILGLAFGRALHGDLLLATQQVSMLGTDRVRHGRARLEGPARFREVAGLGRAVEALADRFGLFARAHQRALRAKESANRMKELLFASVSHDLKSPLNAVLGFADLVADEPLSHAQRESLDMVRGRGQELLALIETILDAARVEAGQLELDPQPVSTDQLLTDALDKAHSLVPQSLIEVIIEIAPNLPLVRVDPTYAARALAVLIAHAMKAGSREVARAIRVRAAMAADGSAPESGGDRFVRIHIEHTSGASRPSLLEDELTGRAPSAMGRGMTMQIGLARSILELHEGSVTVSRGMHGAGVITCALPIARS